MPQRYQELEETTFDAEELLNPRARHTPPDNEEASRNVSPTPAHASQPYQTGEHMAQRMPYSARREDYYSQSQPANAPVETAQDRYGQHEQSPYPHSYAGMYPQPGAGMNPQVSQPQGAPSPQQSYPSATAPGVPYPAPDAAPYTAPYTAPQPTTASAATTASAHKKASDNENDEALITESTIAKLKMFAGIVLFFIAAYTLIVSISYFSSLSHDQSALLGADLEPELYSNAGGMVGSWLSHFLIYEWMGVGAFILIYYVGAISLRLLNIVKFRFWNFTLKCLLSCVAISIIGGCMVEVLNVHTRFYWGGLHGYLINHSMVRLAGIWGALGVAAVMAGLLVVLFIDSLSKASRWLMIHVDKLRERRRREQAEFNARRQEAERQRAEHEAALREQEMAARLEHEQKEAAERAKMAAQPTVQPSTHEFQPQSDGHSEESSRNEIPPTTQADFAQVEPLTHDVNAKVQPEITTPPEPATKPKSVVEEDAPLFADNSVDFQETDEPLFIDDAAYDETVTDAGDEEMTDEPTVDDENSDFTPDFNEDYPESDPNEEVNIPEGEAEVPAEDKSEMENEIIVEDPQKLDNHIEQPQLTAFYDPKAELSHFKFPSLSLLREMTYSTESVDASEMEENKVRITKTLGDYGIPISHIHATVGPTVTLYEIIPAEGVRIAKIKRLEDDIAMSLAALGIRIIAPIPGKGTIGIEVPNKEPQVVSIHSILSSPKFRESKMELPMALGCTISNDVFMADLAKMPHLLVAGATGMGKSVGLNTIIASLLYKKHPTELKFVLIDPKMVEFSLYAGLEKHYLAKLPDEEDAIITDPSKVVATLNSLCIEMDNRYALLKTASCRNIKEYNERIQHGNLMARHEQGHRFLPYIVVIVDEFADLIMTAGKEVETPIARIAQKARAVGIHMILATQRPSTNVITGVIKANFPGRIAFRVFQMVDSRTILDRPGANQLIGRGDMLFSNNGKIERVQCAFIDTPEVEAICEAIGSQVGMEPYPLPEYVPETDALAGLGGNPSDRDPLFGDAARYVVQTDTASTSSLQRRYSIGYNRAGKIMDQLEAAGIVGPAQGGKPRQVLLDSIQVARMLGDE